MKLKDLLNAIISIGTDEHTENGQLKRVRFLNGIAFFGGLFLLLASIVIIFIDYPYSHTFNISKIGQLFFCKDADNQLYESVKLIFPIVNFFTSIFLFLVLLLNYLRKFNVSISILYVVAIFSAFFSYFLKSNYGFFLTIIPSIVPLLFYKKKQCYIPLYLFSYFLFIVSTYIIDGFNMFYHNGINNVLYIYINMSVLYFFIFLIINNFKKENELSEKRLEKQNNTLKSQAVKINAQSAELYKKNIELQSSLLEVNDQKEKIQEINLTLEEANATKDKFFDIIAHDLRSPFNSILGFSNILLENHAEYDNTEREELIKHVVDSSKGAFNLVENLLEWSMVHKGKFIVNSKNIEVEQVLNETLFDIENMAQSKNIEIIIELSKGFSVYADKEILKTILRNVVANAVKFTPRHGTITISAENDDNSTIISVEDTGVGMSEEKIKRLFDITQKTNTLGTDNEAGTGLGLIFCKEVIEKNRGKIWVESEIGKGSIFRLSFPLETKAA